MTTKNDHAELLESFLRFKRAIPAGSMEDAIRSVLYQRRLYAEALDETIRQFDFQDDQAWREEFKNNMLEIAKEKLNDNATK